MDFGLVDSLVCSNSATSASNSGSSLFASDSNDADEANNKQKCYGFGFLKQERAINVNDDDLGDFNKIAKISSLQRSNGCSLTGGHQQMLSFSSPISQAMALPYYHQTSTGFVRNTGYGCSGINAANMQQGVVSGVRRPFTPSQWMELEHQALIYKYITADVPIPSYLLTPIRKAFESAGFPTFPTLRSNALGWGAYHLGFASTDPEPGRCRRTDGKKWRCSRDAVADQKYCERHMNRGRHRSRKPVEGQSGQSASGAVGATTSSGMPAPVAASSASVAAPGGRASNQPVHSRHHQLGSCSNNHPSGIPSISRSVVDKENPDGAYQHPTRSPNHHHLSTGKHHAFREFGLVCSDSLLNPLSRSPSTVSSGSYNNTSDDLDGPTNKTSYPLRQFMDDRTRLSISITSDFMSSSTSSPKNETITASPLRLSAELEMGLGVGPVDTEQNQSRQTNNWVPISWEPSMGGPLGEVLHTTTTSHANAADVGECKNTTPLNLIDTWDNSPRMVSSPTGVLQRGAFGSLSNSSAGSSPRAEICNMLIGGPGLIHPSLPAL
ncbi:hypothetical protein OROGR_026227 [Orobanche gracilis]